LKQGTNHSNILGQGAKNTQGTRNESSTLDAKSVRKGNKLGDAFPAIHGSLARKVLLHQQKEVSGSSVEHASASASASQDTPVSPKKQLRGQQLMI